MCSTLSHSLEGWYEKSECSVLLDVVKAFRAETWWCSLCCAWWLAGPDLFPRPVGISVLMMVSTYIKKGIPKGCFLRSGFQVWFSSSKFRISGTDLIKQFLDFTCRTLKMVLHIIFNTLTYAF